MSASENKACFRDVADGGVLDEFIRYSLSDESVDNFIAKALEWGVSPRSVNDMCKKEEYKVQ